MNEIALAGAAMHRGSSKQDYETPREFMRAVARRFGPIEFDLAASEENKKAIYCYSEDNDALSKDWSERDGLLWLNPPFANIEPWARKCAESASPLTRILLLVPASVGSEWFAAHVYPHAMVYALRPRLSFDGKNPFPKDLILAAYGYGVTGFQLWRWK